MKTIVVRISICIAAFVAIFGFVWEIVCLNTVGLDKIKVASANHRTGTVMEIKYEGEGWHCTNFYQHVIGDRYKLLNTVGAEYAGGWSEDEIYWDSLLTLSAV